MSQLVHELMIYLLNHKGVCRTAPPTPGLLNTSTDLSDQNNSIVYSNATSIAISIFLVFINSIILLMKQLLNKPIGLVIYVYTNKQMLVGVYLEPRWSHPLQNFPKVCRKWEI